MKCWVQGAGYEVVLRKSPLPSSPGADPLPLHVPVPHVLAPSPLPGSASQSSPGWRMAGPGLVARAASFWPGAETCNTSLPGRM